MREFFIRRWFLIVLSIVLAGGIGLSQFPLLRELTSSKSVRYSIVAVVLFVMAFPLDPEAMWRAIRQPWAPLLACAVNFGALPLVGWGLAQGLSGELSSGLLVAAATPSTLASASVWTRRAGGNDAVSILVTVATNVSCFVVTPLWLYVMLGLQADSDALQLGPMIIKLGLVVVAPMTFAQLIRLYHPLGVWAKREKTALGVIAQCGVLSMIFLGSVQLGIRLFAKGQSAIRPLDVGLMVVAVVVLHLSMFFFGMSAAKWCGIQREDRIAVGFSGSQKTLMVGLQVSMDLGFSILPMVTYHVGQLLMDTVIADRLKAGAKGDEPKAAAAPPKE